MAAKGKATGEDVNDFDSFVEPAGLILSTVIGMMPREYHDKGRLLREAEKMKLPGNPLVRPSPYTVLVCCMHGTVAIAKEVDQLCTVVCSPCLHENITHAVQLNSNSVAVQCCLTCGSALASIQPSANGL